MNCQDFWNSFPELAGRGEHPHLAECTACESRMAHYLALKQGFRALSAAGPRLEAPPRVEQRLLSAFRRQTGADFRRPSRRWVPLVTWAAALAAMVALAIFLVRPRAPEAERPPLRRSVEMAMLQVPQADAEGFIPLPNSAGVAADGDEINLVRVEVPRSSMIALGLDVSADRAAELVEADVMLGSNGIARAVRFLE